MMLFILWSAIVRANELTGMHILPLNEKVVSIEIYIACIAYSRVVCVGFVNFVEKRLGRRSKEKKIMVCACFGYHR
ncbi:hypothetical protein BRADI_2g37705v3 [Brachypodium distachyon]|uniref:Uncharacterized protein n=1 Tax=Brachypodium distachyon TaxID=15368 RepID=A0A0Q3G8W5_BRADI|nr:hypothetical protein BRADI_2g37705v3 [Brachypodium distachyon]